MEDWLIAIVAAAFVVCLLVSVAYFIAAVMLFW